MQLYGASYIIRAIIRCTGISHTHFLSYSPKYIYIKTVTKKQKRGMIVVLIPLLVFGIFIRIVYLRFNLNPYSSSISSRLCSIFISLHISMNLSSGTFWICLLLPRTFTETVFSLASLSPRTMMYGALQFL